MPLEHSTTQDQHSTTHDQHSTAQDQHSTAQDQLDSQHRRHPETTKASHKSAGGGVMKTNSVTETHGHDTTTGIQDPMSAREGAPGPAIAAGSPRPPRWDEHGLPTGAALLEWRRAHPDATIADAVAVPRL
ncbi:hypothetical protein [Pseudoclavibacter helvolus]|uniref:hypothetical protein n=1 Tax=Pseudoclavibacter helvolus TaxID=255205 RepID=UPI003C744E64